MKKLALHGINDDGVVNDNVGDNNNNNQFHIVNKVEVINIFGDNNIFISSDNLLSRAFNKFTLSIRKQVTFIDTLKFSLICWAYHCKK